MASPANKLRIPAALAAVFLAPALPGCNGSSSGDGGCVQCEPITSDAGFSDGGLCAEPGDPRLTDPNFYCTSYTPI
jgi:hypothetical protein